jgi:dUTP pyrophosphatase
MSGFGIPEKLMELGRKAVNHGFGTASHSVGQFAYNAYKEGKKEAMESGYKLFSKKIKVKRLDPMAKLPTYAHGPEEDAGMDLYAAEDIIILPNVPTPVRTGLSIELPAGYEGQIRPRSGLAAKHGITIPNSPGTVDPGYRGEIKVILLWDGHNPLHFRTKDPRVGYTHYSAKDREEALRVKAATLEDEPVFVVWSGDRIAQLVVAQYQAVEWEEVSELAETGRGAGGFGSSGQ